MCGNYEHASVIGCTASLNSDAAFFVTRVGGTDLESPRPWKIMMALSPGGGGGGGGDAVFRLKLITVKILSMACCIRFACEKSCSSRVNARSVCSAAAVFLRAVIAFPEVFLRQPTINDAGTNCFHEADQKPRCRDVHIFVHFERPRGTLIAGWYHGYMDLCHLAFALRFNGCYNSGCSGSLGLS